MTQTLKIYFESTKTWIFEMIYDKDTSNLCSPKYFQVQCTNTCSVYLVHVSV